MPSLSPRLSLRLCLVIWVVFQAEARAATISNLLGKGTPGFAGEGRSADQALLNNVFGVARGPDGLIYLCDTDNQRIRRIGRDGIVTTYAGNGSRGYQGDGGQAAAASLNEPYELAWDRQGNLYFVERLNHLVRKVDVQSGRISTVAGTGQPGFEGDGGPASAARFNQPHSLAFDSQGDLYICDIGNHRIRKLDMKKGTISTWAGTGEKRTAADGSAIQGSPLNGPRALTFGPDGVCWLVLREGNAVLRLDPKANTLRRVAGNGKSGFTGNGGPALSATLAGPKGISLDPAGNIYLADTESHSVRWIDIRKGTLEVLVGNGTRGDGPDGGDPLRCTLARPHGVFVDSDGSVLIGDSENHRVRLWKK